MKLTDKQKKIIAYIIAIWFAIFGSIGMVQTGLNIANCARENGSVKKVNAAEIATSSFTLPQMVVMLAPPQDNDTTATAVTHDGRITLEVNQNGFNVVTRYSDGSNPTITYKLSEDKSEYVITIKNLPTLYNKGTYNNNEWTSNITSGNELRIIITDGFSIVNNNVIPTEIPTSAWISAYREQTTQKTKIRRVKANPETMNITTIYDTGIESVIIQPTSSGENYTYTQSGQTQAVESIYGDHEYINIIPTLKEGYILKSVNVNGEYDSFVPKIAEDKKTATWSPSGAVQAGRTMTIETEKENPEPPTPTPSEDIIARYMLNLDDMQHCVVEYDLTLYQDYGWSSARMQPIFGSYILGGNDQGFEQAYLQGYNEAEKNKLTYGETRYNAGVQDGIANANKYTFKGLISAVFDVPIQTIWGMLNFNILGVNILTLITSIVSLVIIIAIIRRIT